MNVYYRGRRKASEGMEEEGWVAGRAKGPKFAFVFIELVWGPKEFSRSIYLIYQRHTHERQGQGGENDLQLKAFKELAPI